MKDFSEEQCRMALPTEDAGRLVKFCLDRLFADRQRVTTDLVCFGLNYEELLGALLAAEENL